MSPRPRNVRTVFDPPRFRGYRPYGAIPANTKPVKLLYEEYAAIKLCDFELLNQSEAATAMGVSRPTFTRIYESARRKIARALAGARPIEMEYGAARFDHDWFRCNKCLVYFTMPGPDFDGQACPLCGSAGTDQVGSVEPDWERATEEKPLIP